MGDMGAGGRSMADLCTQILDFRGFHSSIIIIRGGILTSTGNFSESLSLRIFVGIILVGRLGVTQAGRLAGQLPHI